MEQQKRTISALIKRARRSCVRSLSTRNSSRAGYAAVANLIKSLRMVLFGWCYFPAARWARPGNR
jgi:hypothetical protein